MACREDLVERIRAALADCTDVSERKTFGGLTFMLRGNMCCGVDKRNLMVRVGPEGYESDDGLRGWVERGVEYALSLPAK